MSNWKNFITQLEKDLTFWIGSLLYFFSYRLFLILSLADKDLSEFNVKELLDVLYIGLRFDLVPSTIIIMLPLIFSLACLFGKNSLLANKVRLKTLWLAVLLTLFLSLVNFFFFKEYKEQFNYWIFGIIYDDQIAILKTIWQDSPVIWFFIIWITGSWGLVWIIKKLILLRPIRLTLIQDLNNKYLQGIFLLVLCVLLIGGLRGGYRNRPIQIKDIEKTQDSFLNKTIPNFYKALENTIKIYRRNSDLNRLPSWTPNNDIRQASQIFFGKYCPKIDKCLEKTANGALLKSKPQHIFLLIMESYDLWSFFPPYNELGLTANGQELAKKGLFWTNFTSAGGGTMPTVSSIISGVPQVGLQFAYQKNMQLPQPTSIAEIFKALGYKTKFYYGGYLSWQNVGRFVTSQGFDEVIGANTIAPDFPFGDWGIPDKDLFNYVAADTIKETKPTLNVILSLSYHRPFKIDIWQEGFVPPKLNAETQSLNDSKDALAVLGHFWYSDKVLGEFVRKVEGKFKNSLFIITGDHWSRKGLTQKYSNIYQQNAVPLIIYGSRVLKSVLSLPAFKKQFKNGELRAPGDSLDIVPTVVELIAPKGFRYHTYGNNLFGLSKKLFATGGTSEVILGKDFMFEVDNPNYIYVRDGKPLESLGEAVNKQNLERLIQLHFARKAIAWWQTMRGNELN